MTGKELKIIFRNDKAYLTPEHFLTFNQIGLPNIVESFDQGAFLVFRVIRFIEKDQKLFCEILSYHRGSSDFSNDQRSFYNQLNTIQTITFRTLDTTSLLGLLPSTTQVRNSFIPPISSRLADPVPFSEIKTTRLPVRKTITKTFWEPLKDVRFRLGGVSFNKKFAGYDNFIEINIENPEIREEFDAVKDYFANVLNTKRIEVSVTIEIEDDRIISNIAKCPEIDRIDASLIEKVKFEFVKGIKKKVFIDVDVNLLTMEDYLSRYGEKNFEANVFYGNEKELLEDLLQITNTKHYKHLRFLSSKHQHNIMKLRFIHKPLSFIFLLSGARKYHLIWETLDTEEATYIWHVEKNYDAVKASLNKIDDILNLIKVQGKSAYLNSTEDSFKRVYHDYSPLLDGFVKWKDDLESSLI